MTNVHYCCIIKVVHALLGGNPFIHSYIHSFIHVIQQTASQVCAEAVRHWGHKNDSPSATLVWCRYQVSEQGQAVGPRSHHQMTQALSLSRKQRSLHRGGGKRARP